MKTLARLLLLCFAASLGAVASPVVDTAALVRRLGADSFGVRERATRQLLALGQAAEEAVREGQSDADAEVSGRCKALLPRLQKARLETRIKVFLSDDKVVLPGRETFAKLVGGDESARKHFGELFCSQADWLESARQNDRLSSLTPVRPPPGSRIVFEMPLFATACCGVPASSWRFGAGYRGRAGSATGWRAEGVADRGPCGRRVLIWPRRRDAPTGPPPDRRCGRLRLIDQHRNRTYQTARVVNQREESGLERGSKTRGEGPGHASGGGTSRPARRARDERGRNLTRALDTPDLAPRTRRGQHRCRGICGAGGIARRGPAAHAREELVP